MTNEPMSIERRELADLCADILFRYHGIITSSGPQWADELMEAGYRKDPTK